MRIIIINTDKMFQVENPKSHNFTVFGQLFRVLSPAPQRCRLWRPASRALCWVRVRARRRCLQLVFFSTFSTLQYVMLKKTRVLNSDAFGHSLSSFTWARHTESLCCHGAVNVLSLCFRCLWLALKGSRGSSHGNRIDGLRRGFWVVVFVQIFAAEPREHQTYLDEF